MERDCKVSVGARKCRTSRAGEEDEPTPLVASWYGWTDERDSYDGGMSVSGG